MSEKHTKKGFTIIELMIATTVFGIVLLVAASGILTIGRLFYKGITSSRTQEASRSVIDTISGTIQLSTGSMMDDDTIDTAGVPQSVCFGYDRYTYVINSQVTGPGTIGLMHDRRTSLSDCSPLGGGGSELLPENTRLLDFRVTSIDPSTFRINVKVAYGDNDLLSTYDGNGAPIIGGPGHPDIEESRNAQCKPGIAASFCAVSELETTVTKRVK